MYTLTLIYTDGTRWIAGGFNTMDALNKWVADQKLPEGTQTEILDNTPKPL